VALEYATLAGLIAFGLIALAALRIGGAFARWRLPLITGFLVTGAVAGPSVLGMIPAEALPRLQIVDQVALAFIGFAAGGELYFAALRGRLRAIAWTTGGLVTVTFSIGTLTAYTLFARVPVIAELGDGGRLAVAALAGAILVARSPSSAIAIVRELRARGPFTRTALGVTVVMDAVVIMVFAGAAATADAVLTGSSLDLPGIGLLVVDLAISVGLGWVAGHVLALVIRTPLSATAKIASILAIGAAAFRFSSFARHASESALGFEILPEPLMLCMIAGITVTNFTPQRLEFEKLLHRAGPTVYVVFFTLTGASLDLRVLAGGLTIAVAMVTVRIATIALGSWLGGTIAGVPGRHNRLAWAGYVTQAGVGLGLAKDVAVEFPDWGGVFASLMIGVIVMNQLLGPPLFKWVLKRVGEAHPQADEPEFDGTRDVLIFGLENQSLALARQLAGHGWDVRIASRRALTGTIDEHVPGVDIVGIESLEPPCLKKLEAHRFEAVVTLLNDEENLKICEMIYENVGIRHVVVHLHDHANAERFRELGAIPVEPGTAFVGLLDHMVRSPAATAMMLGLDREQDVQEIEVRNDLLHGKALRDIDLPVDALVLSVVRGQRQVVSHGYTRLELGDHLTVMGDQDSLEDVRRRVEG